MPSLLLEIGTEEIPASFLKPAGQELVRRVTTLLGENGISFECPELFYTPRRLGLRLQGVASERPARATEIQGPPARVALGPDQKPTKTGIGFARAHGKTPEELKVKSTPKGEYVFLDKDVPALRTTELLERELPAIVTQIPFPKTMRWLVDKTRFARPVRWLLCILGAETVPFSFAGLTATNVTFGHRGSAPAGRAVTNPESYETILSQCQVVADPEARQILVLEGAKELARTVAATPVLDPELIEETVNVVESPLPILCRLDPEHLKLPRLVLITALKKHQRCFALEDENHVLKPHFIAVTNTPDCDQKQVAHWYEDAVDSRLRDARFFFEADLNRGLEPLVEAEKRVTWIEGIGSYFDKTVHLRAICAHLAAEVPDTDPRLLDRAAYLAKADLLTDMVREKEFTSLQGQIGGIYAQLLGEPEPVAQAIAEHYLPQSVEDEPPASLAGALLCIADKIDNITATFLTGSIPTGSEDPFALRRQATGILATILVRNLPVDLSRLISVSLAQFQNPDQNFAARIPPFFQERLEALFSEKGITYDITESVLETTWQLPCQALTAAKALLRFRPKPEFERLIIGQKRVANILRGLDISGLRIENIDKTKPDSCLPDPARLIEPAEKELWQNARAIEPMLDQAVATPDFDRAFELLLGLRISIDRLFDDVLVMTEDQELRLNRLRLLLYVRSLFRKVADLSRVVLEGESQPAPPGPSVP